MKKLIDTIWYFISLYVMAFGITMVLTSNLGTGGWDALAENLYKLTDINIGTWVFILGIITILIVAIIEKSKPDLRIIVISFVLGKLIDLNYYVIFDGVEFNIILVKAIFFFGGLAVIASGCAMMFCTNFPKNNVEAFVFALVNKFGLSYALSKTLIEIGVLSLALILGGILKDFSNLGIGTVLCTILIGPMLNVVQPVVKKLYSQVQAEEKNNQIINA